MNTTKMLSRAAVLGAAAYGLRAFLRRRRQTSLQNASVVITGGSRGLGLELARQMIEAGARVSVLARSAEELEEARSTLEGSETRGARNGSSVLVVACDVSDPDDAASAIETVLRTCGRIDVLINNAGQIQVGPLAHMTRADFEHAMAVHFQGAVNTTMEVLPSMLAQRSGRIANISSVGGKVAVPHLAPYCASKFALVGFSDGIRAELGRYGIRVLTVVPGLMRTGSHVNAEFRGRHDREEAWFSSALELPIAALPADKAARRIIRAIERGDPALHLGFGVSSLAVANALAPGWFGEAMALAERFFPNEEASQGDVGLSGAESRSDRGVRLPTTKADQASARHNELPPDSEVEA